MLFLVMIDKEPDIGIKQEEIPEDINFSGIKSEPDEVCSVFVYMSVSVHIVPLSINIVFFVCDVNIYVISMSN